MSISKLRGKSDLARNEKTQATTKSTAAAGIEIYNGISTTMPAVAVAAIQHQNQDAKYLYAPPAPPPPLIIEPFVPRFSTKIRRPIHRSYSTLTKGNIANNNQQKQQQKLPAYPIDGVLSHVSHRQLHKRQQNGFKMTMSSSKHRSKSSCCSSSSTNGNNSSGQQPNGVCKITRSLKDQEKLPDRINYDRRGLTAIPIFENEQNLRLLSLQHNLINIFHIPKDQQQIAIETSSSNSDEVNKKPSGITEAGCGLASKLKLLNVKTTNNPTFSLQPSSGVKITSNTTSTTNNKFTARNATVVLHTNQNLQQQQQQQRFGSLKKSKSFISNYSKHMNSIKRNLQKPAAKTDCIQTGFFPLNSFDCGTSGTSSVITNESNNTNEENLQLSVKNNQLVPSYEFPNLVFLDLYDNQIERINNLDGLPALSVLLLGKNRISDIAGLASLKKTLRVLDLHGNKITSINNKINCLQELKSLNLAGNQIRQINANDFCGLINLKELNLKRNKIKRAMGFQHLTVLERLWLCHNDLHKIEDMSSIAKAINLLEVTVENNPVSLAGDCVSFLVSYLPNLQKLSQMPITEQVRRAAMAWRQNKELSDANYSNLSSEVFSNIRREEVISNARTNWELLRSQQTMSVVSGRNPRLTMSPKRYDLSKISETFSEGAVVINELQEYIKLPPIQKQQQQPNGLNSVSGENLNRSTSSTSSLGPNVDSSSSYFSSDNEDIIANTALKKQTDTGTMQSAKQKQPVTLTLFETAQVFGDVTLNPYLSNKPNQMSDGTAMACDGGGKSNSSGNSTINNIKEEKPQDRNSNVGRSNENEKLFANEEDVNGDNSDKSNTNVNVNVAVASLLRSHEERSFAPTNNVTLSLGMNGNAGTTMTTTTMPASTTTKNPPQPFVNGNINAKRCTLGSLTRSQTIAKTSISQRTSGTNLTTANGTNAIGSGICVSSSSSITNISGIISAASTTNTSTVTVNSSAPATSCSTPNLAVTIVMAAANKTSTATTTVSSTKQLVEREREQGGDYLIEICGRYLNIYGVGALRFIDKQWNQTKANDVHTLNFSYINFNNITSVLGRIKVRFPHAEHFVFRETNITCLGQLNAFAELQGICSLCIDPDGNAITTKDLWRLYSIYRLSHWGLKMVNGNEVTDSEIDEAHAIYAGLSDLVLWSMPEACCSRLLARLRLDETCTASKLTAKEWLMRADQSLRIVVGKEALQWKKTNQPPTLHSNGVYSSSSSSSSSCNHAHNHFEEASPSRRAMRERGKKHFAMMIENTCNAVEKLNKLESLWPSLLLEIVRNTLLDYSQMDDYLNDLMAEVMNDS